MRLMISFAALFLPMILLQISTGGVRPLDALSRFALNFSNTEIGMLGSAHFFGFFIGCWYAPNYGSGWAFTSVCCFSDGKFWSKHNVYTYCFCSFVTCYFWCGKNEGAANCVGTNPLRLYAKNFIFNRPLIKAS